jgi:hypothetical protein
MVRLSFLVFEEREWRFESDCGLLEEVEVLEDLLRMEGRFLGAVGAWFDSLVPCVFLSAAWGLILPFHKYCYRSKRFFGCENVVWCVVVAE